MRTSSRAVTLVLFDEVEVLDFAGALQVLTQAGRQWNWRPFKVATAAAKSGPIQTRNQLGVLAEHDPSSCPTCELLIVPGGYGARRAADDDGVRELVARQGAKAELVLAIGWGVLLAARAGLVDGAEIVAPPDAAELVSEAAPTATLLEGRRLASSGKLLTGTGGGVSVDLGLMALSRVLGAKQAVTVAQALGHEWSEGAPEPLRIDIVTSE